MGKINKKKYNENINKESVVTFGLKPKLSHVNVVVYQNTKWSEYLRTERFQSTNSSVFISLNVSVVRTVDLMDAHATDLCRSCNRIGRFPIMHGDMETEARVVYFNDFTDGSGGGGGVGGGSVSWGLLLTDFQFYVHS